MTNNGFNTGNKLLKSFITTGDGVDWVNSKLTEDLFIASELDLFKFIQSHMGKYNKLPSEITISEVFPDFVTIQAPESPKYYLDKIRARYSYTKLNSTILEAHSLLKDNKGKTYEAEDLLNEALRDIRTKRYANKVLDVGTDAKSLVLNHYHQKSSNLTNCVTGWDYLDKSGTLVGGDVISIVGRPAAGKSWLSLHMALENWRRGNDVIFASMEMNSLRVAQRISAMYATTPVGEITSASMPTAMYNSFIKGVSTMESEVAKFHVIDGNLAATCEEIYSLASGFQSKLVVIDGAYLMRHPNPRLNRFERAAENAELIKRYTSDLNIPNLSMWQLARTASKKNKNKEGDAIGLEDIGYSDAIPQVSSIVLGLLQGESIETLLHREVSVMKGRNGEIGSFSINWDFHGMDFSELTEKPTDMSYI